MNRIRKILAPTDLSELSVAGLRYALDMIADGDAEVIVYNVIGPGEPSIPLELADWVAAHAELPRVQQIVQKRKGLVATFLLEYFGSLTSELKLRIAVDTGLPEKKIVEKASEEGADLIVMSTHGRTGFRHMIIGSVTEKVIRRAACPVLTIHPARPRAIPRAVA